LALLFEQNETDKNPVKDTQSTYQRNNDLRGHCERKKTLFKSTN